MSSKIIFSLKDAIYAIRQFHCLPDDATISIEIDGALFTHSETKYTEIIDKMKKGLGGSFDFGAKIPAIKQLKLNTNLGLKEAKSIIDVFFNSKDESVLENELKKYV